MRFSITILAFALALALSCSPTARPDNAQDSVFDANPDGAWQDTTPDTPADIPADTQADTTPDLPPDTPQEIITPPLSCNGGPALCGRPFDEVAVVCTHNGFANEEDGFWPPNHVFSLAHQLEDGVRCLMLDLHYADDGTPSLCHGDCFWGQRPLDEGLAVLRAYLDADPGAVLTLILENYIDHADIEAAMAAGGLLELAYAHEAGTPWPTLGEMVAAGQRVVVLGSDGGSAHPWILDTWTEAFETDWSNKVAEDLDCDVNRGSPDNPLFILNHFVADPLPEPSQAATVNFNPFFIERALACQAEHEQIPNFVTVDFYGVGDVFDVVDVLNNQWR
jgi:hypothetical protein